ncbi:MAG TPA: DUF1629 domain-containing protein [Rhizobacter sp.]|nr:DUF1629 domain-containing protein [Rhizobacter sp.]
MSNPFVQFDTVAVKNAAAVMDLQGVANSEDMMDGVSFKKAFPSTAAFHFNPDFKRNTLLVDCLVNVENMMVCSARLKDFIQAKKPDKVEYLPVAVVDLKGKAVADAYFIVHPIDPPDCIDVANSDVTLSALDPGVIRYAEHIEIDASKVPEGRLLFRPKTFPGILLLRRELALDIEKAGFTGIGWDEIA